MSSVTLTGGAQAVPIAARENGLTGQNAGPGNLYISQSPDVSPTNYDGLIGSNGSFDRPPNSTTFVCTDPGTTAAITYFNDGTQVSQGTVLTQSVNNQVLLGSARETIATGTFGTYDFESIPSVISTKGFASIKVVINMWGLDGAVAPAAANYLRFIGYQLKDGFSDGALIGNAFNTEAVIDQADSQFLVACGNATSMEATYTSSHQFPVRGSYLSPFLAVNKGVATVGRVVVFISVYGSNEVINDDLYVHNNPYFNLAGSNLDKLSVNGAVRIVGTNTFFFAHANKTTYSTLYKDNVSSVTQTAFIRKLDISVASTLIPYTFQSTDPQFTTIDRTFRLPTLPVYMDFGSTQQQIWLSQ